jgi:TonB family protein
VIGFCAACGPVYTSNENASLIGTIENEPDFDSPPVPIQMVRPEYPEIARKMGMEGVVRLKVLVLEDGDVGGIEIIESANPLLLDAAITALRQSMFSPARKSGRPCCGTVIIPFVFGKEESWAESLRGLNTDYSGAAVEDESLTNTYQANPERDIRAAK